MNDQITPAAAREMVIGRTNIVRKTAPPRVACHTRIDTSSENAATSSGKTTSQMAVLSAAFQKLGSVRVAE